MPIVEIQRPFDHEVYIKAKNKSPKSKKNSDSQLHVILCLKTIREKMKLNETQRRKLERQSSWQWAQHTVLYSDLLFKKIDSSGFLAEGTLISAFAVAHHGKNHIRLVWCSVQKAHLHIQVNFTYVKIEGHVSNDRSGGTSDRRENSVKLEWIE